MKQLIFTLTLICSFSIFGQNTFSELKTLVKERITLPFDTKKVTYPSLGFAFDATLDYIADEELEEALEYQKELELKYPNVTEYFNKIYSEDITGNILVGSPETELNVLGYFTIGDFYFLALHESSFGRYQGELVINYTIVAFDNSGNLLDERTFMTVYSTYDFTEEGYTHYYTTEFNSVLLTDKNSLRIDAESYYYESISGDESDNKPFNEELVKYNVPFDVVSKKFIEPEN